MVMEQPDRVEPPSDYPAPTNINPIPALPVSSRMTRIKLRLRRMVGSPDTILATVFLGTEGQTLQNAGQLFLRVDEYKSLASALTIGAEHNVLHFEVEDEAISEG